MNWTVQALIQNAVACLPSSVSYAVYYRLQRHFGGLSTINPVGKLRAAVETWQLAQDPVGAVLLEVGTGRAPMVPITYWLMGAERVITIDLNPYLADAVLRESLVYLRDHDGEIVSLLGRRLVLSRWSALLDLIRSSRYSTSAVLRLCQIDYVAPGDATRTGLPDASVDVHTSYTVLEHIPPDVITGILTEASRILRPNGLCVHLVDYSDHFAHNDHRLSNINFLQYSDGLWHVIAGNRYMYMNRLRHDAMLTLFQGASHRIVSVTPEVDTVAQSVLRNGFKLAEPYRSMSQDILAITSAWIVSTPPGRRRGVSLGDYPAFPDAERR